MTFVKLQAQLFGLFGGQVGEEMADQGFAVEKVLEVGLGVFAEQAQAAGRVVQLFYQILPDFYDPLAIGGTERLVGEIAGDEELVVLVHQVQVLGPEQDAEIVGKVGVEYRDVDFRVVTHPAIIEIG